MNRKEEIMELDEFKELSFEDQMTVLEKIDPHSVDAMREGFNEAIIATEMADIIRDKVYELAEDHDNEAIFVGLSQVWIEVMDRVLTVSPGSGALMIYTISNALREHGHPVIFDFIDTEG